MVDKSVGAAGTLRITDDGSTVRFYVLCSDPATSVGTYRYAINGTNYTTTLPSGFGERLLGTRTYSASTSVSLSQQATGTYGLGGAASVSASIVRAKPTAPFDLSVSRVSDTQQTLSWSRYGGYSSQIIQRRVAAGSGWGAWQQIASINGTATGYTDRSTAANRRYEYRVAAKAPSGQSGWSNTDEVYTTPATPTGVKAARSGANIVVSASGEPPYATSYDVRDGGSTVATSVSLPWTHVAPNPAVSHTYTVRGKRGSLTSGYSAASNTVQLISPPNPPTGLAPNGAVRPSDEDVTFTWVHNPVDSSDQSAYELRYREPAGAWTTLDGTTDSSRVVTLPVGDVEWEVRTKGEHPDWSPWSATAVFSVIDRPGVAVTSPESDWDSSTLPVEWSWFQPQERPQSAWEAELVDPAGDVVEARSGSGATSTVTFTTRLTEGEWAVRVRAATGDVWSVWAEQSFTVTFDPPAPPVVEGVWDDSQGGVFLTVGVGSSGAAVLGEDGAWYAEFPSEESSSVGFDDGHPFVEDGSDEGVLFDGETVSISDVEPPATTSVLLERSIDGEAWELVSATDSVSSLIDWESWSYGDIQYRATAFTAEGATASTEVTVEARSRALWLSSGIGFEETCRLPLNPNVHHSGGRERAMKRYAGRSVPVAMTGEGTFRTVQVSGNVWDSGETASPDDLISVSQAETDLFLFRDPDGRRIRGVVSEISLPRLTSSSSSEGWNGYWGYSFTLTEASR